MKGINFPTTFLIFLILFLIISAILLLWHIEGFTLFSGMADNLTENVTHGIRGI